MSLVELRKSPIHGNGVFAMVNIKKDTKICYYDGEDKNILDCLNEQTQDFIYLLKHPNMKLIRDGYREPKSEIGVGQFINEAYFPNLDLPNTIYEDSFSELRDFFLDCEKKSSIIKNVAFRKDGELFWLYATRDINKGDELLMTYGGGYWVLYYLHRCQNILWRFILFKLLMKENNISDKDAIKIINGILGENSDIWKIINIDEKLSPSEKIKQLSLFLRITN